MINRIERKDVPDELIVNSMKAVFNGDIYDKDFFRFDFMWVAHNENMEPECFTLCQELNKNMIWLAYGGALPHKRGFSTVKNFARMIAELSKDYKLIGAQVENTNFAMLKIYIAHDFKIAGVRQNHNGKVFVEFLKEVQHG